MKVFIYNEKKNHPKPREVCEMSSYSFLQSRVNWYLRRNWFIAVMNCDYSCNQWQSGETFEYFFFFLSGLTIFVLLAMESWINMRSSPWANMSTFYIIICLLVTHITFIFGVHLNLKVHASVGCAAVDNGEGLMMLR